MLWDQVADERIPCAVAVMKKYVPDTVFKSFKGMDHGEITLFYPERMARELLKL